MFIMLAYKREMIIKAEQGEISKWRISNCELRSNPREENTPEGEIAQKVRYYKRVGILY